MTLTAPHHFHSPIYETYCIDHYADGRCDQGCNSEECGWDGLDCSGDVPPKLADGTLVIVVLLQPNELKRDLKGFLRTLSSLLHTNVRVKLDDQENTMIFPYYGEESGGHGGVAAMKQRGKREVTKDAIG